MYAERQIGKILQKLKRFEDMLEPHLFEKVDELTEVSSYHTAEALDRIPDASLFQAVKSGDMWEGEGTYCWYRSTYTVPERLQGETLYLYPRIGGYEGLLWVNGVPHGNYATKIAYNKHGNHYCDHIATDVKAGQKIDLAIEYYAHHYMIGTMPFQKDPMPDFKFTYEGVDVCRKDKEINDFYFDLKIINQMVEVFPKESFRRAELIKALLQVHDIIYYDEEHVDKEAFRGALRQAAPILRAELEKKNPEGGPSIGIIGHSHMDTAWLWHIGETKKKCARTYANQMAFMDEYPEYMFVQSSTFHSEMMRDSYPELFEQIRQRVKEGRYEPNGGVFIECDCNIPSGESMVRQFLIGQQFSKKEFDYRADTFWLPDTFGYSAALPQIMQGCGIKYFLTTKLSWNDTNQFPYDTFYWKGIDGSQVLVHFNKSHLWPDPKSISWCMLQDGPESVQEKTVTDKKLFSYGFGDGGGGPMFEMIEMARREKDVNGLPRMEHTSVSQFMQDLEKSLFEPSTYNGELYLELHRGTLTNQHPIKRNNRLAEIALHDLEYLTVRKGLKADIVPEDERIRPLLKTLLKNQFHDILPGTCIPRAHDEAIADVSGVITKTRELTKEVAADLAKDDARTITVLNTLSFDRNDVLYLDVEPGLKVEGDYAQQIVEDVEGHRKLAVAGVTIPAFGSVVLTLVPGEIVGDSVFEHQGDVLTTPYAVLTFNEKGYIKSFIDRRNGREVCGEGYALNTLLIAEDVPLIYDNWDIDADIRNKWQDSAKLLERQIVSAGPVEYRIRSRYQLTEISTVTQDMVVYADNPLVRFDTVMNWQEEHRFLKAAFDTSLFTDTARHEVQFGYLKRGTHRNTSVDKARFEVSNHKYTDMSEARYGAAILNDCKYGISVEDGKMRLSLHKGGNRPDYRGDKGVHVCSYGFLPHAGDFDTQNVIRPAYEFNYKPVQAAGSIPMESLLTLDCDCVLAETIKPAENGEKALVIRLYEAEGANVTTNLHLGFPVKAVEETNMLEETKQTLTAGQDISLHFGPFEIKTIKVFF